MVFEVPLELVVVAVEVECLDYSPQRLESEEGVFCLEGEVQDEVKDPARYQRQFRFQDLRNGCFPAVGRLLGHGRGDSRASFVHLLQ
jgi:hypothetical protein